MALLKDMLNPLKQNILVKIMKKNLIILFVFLSFIFKGQDTLLFNYLNQYRINNGKAAIQWSDKLMVTSFKQTEAIVKKDSLFHSKTNTIECLTKGYNLVATESDKTKFIAFLKKNFKMNYNDPVITRNENGVIKYVLLYIIYKLDADSAHKALILDNKIKFGSSAIMFKDIKFKSNKIVINGETKEYKNFIDHYEVKYFSTINLN